MTIMNPAATTPQRINVVEQGVRYEMECNVCGATGFGRTSLQAARNDAADHRRANEACRTLGAGR